MGDEEKSAFPTDSNDWILHVLPAMACEETLRTRSVDGNQPRSVEKASCRLLSSCFESRRVVHILSSYY